MISKKCEVSDCNKTARTNSAKYCEMHYTRERRYGDITHVRNHSKIDYRLPNGYRVQTKEILTNLQNIAESLRDSKSLTGKELGFFIRKELGLVSSKLRRKYFTFITDNCKIDKGKLQTESFCKLFD